MANNRIGIIDADLIGRGTRHPNLTCMKLSGYHKDVLHDEVELVESWDDVLQGGFEAHTYDWLYMAKVFDFTDVPEPVWHLSNLTYGGTGVYFQPYVCNDGVYDEAGMDVYRDHGDHMLPGFIEHHMPDYSLYDAFVAKEIARGIRPQHYRDYKDFSIGFTTRGCFRHCDFCVNHESAGVQFHAHVEEFFDSRRKYIYLWDDNILGYPKWRDVFRELEATGRRFQFRQGMDIRLMTDEKAEVLTKAKYYGDYIFAFDHPEEQPLIERGLQCWKRHNRTITKVYVLCGFDNQDIRDVVSTFERIRVLMKYGCLPYIMRHENYKSSPYSGTYTNLARWCNQPAFFKKKSYREYCEANGEKSATMQYLRKLEHDYPAVAEKYFDLRWDQLLEY